MAKVINSTEVISNSVRWTNVHVFKPTSIRGSKPRYSTTLIIPKSDIETISKVQSALQDAYEDLQRFDDSTPDFSKIKNPLQDGDICFPNKPEYRDSYFINAYSYEPLGVFDEELNPLQTPSEVYNGVWGKADITFFPYHYGDTFGIGCNLNGLQKLKDDRPIGSQNYKKVSAKENFAVDADENFS